MISIREHLTQALGLPPAAVEWLLSLYQAIQFFDDVADGDSINRADLNSALWSVLVSMPSNEFFRAHSASLIPIVATQILKWQASDHSERNGTADAKSFVWRAGFYDLVIFVVALIHGHEAATRASEAVLRIYGETLDAYLKEFTHA